MVLRIFIASYGIFCGGAWTPYLWHVGFGAPAHGHSSCGVRALEHSALVVAVPGLSCSVACEILVPLPGIEPRSPALQGGFLSTGPPV